VAAAFSLLAAGCAGQVIHHERESVHAVAHEVQLLLSLNHPNVVRAYHCITRQLVPAAQQPSQAEASPQPRQLSSITSKSVGGSSRQLSAILGPQDNAAQATATSSVGGSSRQHSTSLGPPTEDHAALPTPGRVPSATISSAATAQQQRQQPQHLHKQQQTQSHLAADTSPVPDRGSGSISHGLADRLMQPQQQQLLQPPQQRFTAQQLSMPFQGELEMTARRASSSFSTAGSVLSPVRPSTPPRGTEAAAATTTTATASVAGTGTQSLLHAGITGSSGLGSLPHSGFIHDLEHPVAVPSDGMKPAYQHKMPLQSPLLGPASVSSSSTQQELETASLGHLEQQHVPHQHHQQQQQQQQAAGSMLSPDQQASLGPGMVVMTLPAESSPSPAAPRASGLAILTCSTVSNTSTDSLKTPCSMSSLQCSAGPMSLVGSLVGSRTYGSTGSLVGSRTYGSTGSQPLPLVGSRRYGSNGSLIGSRPYGSAGSPLQVARDGGSQSVKSTTGSCSSSLQPQSASAGAAFGSGPGRLQTLGEAGMQQEIAVGGSTQQTVSAVGSRPGAESATGAGRSLPSSSSGRPSPRSLGSQAWPLILSPSRDSPVAAGVTGAEGLHLADGGVAGGTVGGSSGGVWQKGRASAAMCETWLVTELCDM